MKARDVMAAAQTEAEFEHLVVQLATAHGWTAYHTRFSKGSQAGYPDWTFVRDGVLIFAELKKESGRMTPAQQRWHHLLKEVEYSSPGSVFVRCWKPSDMAEVENLLRGRPRRFHRDQEV